MIRTVCVICKKIGIGYKTCYNGDTLCYLTNLKNIIFNYYRVVLTKYCLV